MTKTKSPTLVSQLQITRRTATNTGAQKSFELEIQELIDQLPKLIFRLRALIYPLKQSSLLASKVPKGLTDFFQHRGKVGSWWMFGKPATVLQYRRQECVLLSLYRKAFGSAFSPPCCLLRTSGRWSMWRPRGRKSWWTWHPTKGRVWIVTSSSATRWAPLGRWPSRRSRYWRSARRRGFDSRPDLTWGDYGWASAWRRAARTSWCATGPEKNVQHVRRA